MPARGRSRAEVRSPSVILLPVWRRACLWSRSIEAARGRREGCHHLVGGIGVECDDQAGSMPRAAGPVHFDWRRPDERIAPADLLVPISRELA